MSSIRNHDIEPLLTLSEAAERCNLKYWQLQRAARRQLFPTYRVGNGRIRVRLSEIEAFIERSRVGGGQWPAKS